MAQKQKANINGRLQIEYKDVNSISILVKNIKRHDLDETEASIRLRGVIDPIGINPITGNAFDGNGRTETLQIMHANWLDEGAQPSDVPTGIVVENGNWLVPTVAVEMTETEEIAAAAALNRIAERGGFDDALMVEILQELKENDALTATGYTDDDLAELLKKFPAEKPKAVKAEGEKDVDDELQAELKPDISNAPPSTIKQVQLLFTPENHARFVEAAFKLSEMLEIDNVSDTVLRALEETLETNQKLKQIIAEEFGE